MTTSKQATAPIETRAVASHKEDTATLGLTSQKTVADVNAALVKWYSGGPRPSPAIMMYARSIGLPDQVPAKARDRVMVLALAGLDVEDVIAAVPQLHPVDIAETIDKIPGSAFSIVQGHLGGLTPVEIATEIGSSRNRVYYWLRKLGQEPNVRTRKELTTRQRDQIVKAWQAGEPTASIARRFGVAYHQVRYAVQKSQ